MCVSINNLAGSWNRKHVNFEWLEDILERGIIVSRNLFYEIKEMILYHVRRTFGLQPGITLMNT